MKKIASDRNYKLALASDKQFKFILEMLDTHGKHLESLSDHIRLLETRIRQKENRTKQQASTLPEPVPRNPAESGRNPRQVNLEAGAHPSERVND